MKKLISLLMVFSMLAMLCACGSSETEQPAQNGSDTPSQTTEAVSADGDSLVPALKEILGSAISLDDYELVYQDEEIVNLYLIDGEYIELDYTINLAGGSTIQLPMIYSELLEAGWTSSVQWDETAEANSVGGAAHVNADGNTIYVSICNPTSEAMDLNDIWVNSITLGGDFTAEGNVGGIGVGSSIGDLVAAWGKPYNISYYCDEDFSRLELNYEASDGELAICIDTQTGLISTVVCHFSTDHIG